VGSLRPAQHPSSHLAPPPTDVVRRPHHMHPYGPGQDVDLVLPEPPPFIARWKGRKFPIDASSLAVRAQKRKAEDRAPLVLPMLPSVPAVRNDKSDCISSRDSAPLGLPSFIRPLTDTAPNSEEYRYGFTSQLQGHNITPPREDNHHQRGVDEVGA